MNFKHLFPTFRNRYNFVKSRIARLSQVHRLERTFNLGTGEGDYDRMLARYSQQMIACDINQADVDYAASLNKDVLNLHYEVNNALGLTHHNSSFDLVVSCEVIEHVGQPALMMKEIGRVLVPGGYAIITFPSREFPFTYDPVNRIWQWIKGANRKENLISQGAYAFGHEYLIGSREFMEWAKDAQLDVVEFKPLSGALVGLTEMYWTGIVQRIFKKNSRNVVNDSQGGLKVRPTDFEEPWLSKLTDALLWLDEFWFGAFSRSVGKGVVLRKRMPE